MTAQLNARVVISGTGTGIGKTEFTLALQGVCRLQNIRCLALKPIESGYLADSSDAARLGAGDLQPIEPAYALIEALSPHLAAERQGQRLDLAWVQTWVEQHEQRWLNAEPTLTSTRAVSLIELAGGLFTPLTLAETNLSLLRLLEPCRFVLVASDRLGVLHDLGACLAAAAACHRVPDLVVFSRGQPDASTASNRGEFMRLFPHVPCCVLSAQREIDLDVPAWLATTGALS